MHCSVETGLTYRCWSVHTCNVYSCRVYCTLHGGISHFHNKNARIVWSIWFKIHIISIQWFGLNFQLCSHTNPPKQWLRCDLVSVQQRIKQEQHCMSVIYPSAQLRTLKRKACSLLSHFLHFLICQNHKICLKFKSPELHRSATKKWMC